MTFVNEFIPQDDLKRYAIEEIDAKFVGGNRSRDWTIDRDRDIYLRNVSVGAGSDPDYRNQTTWTFFWRGQAMTVRLDLLKTTGKAGESGWSHWLLVWVNGSNGLPEKLRPSKQEFLEDLIEALTIYKSGGVFSAEHSDYSITLDVSKECVL